MRNDDTAADILFTGDRVLGSGHLQEALEIPLRAGSENAAYDHGVYRASLVLEPGVRAGQRFVYFVSLCDSWDRRSIPSGSPSAVCRCRPADDPRVPRAQVEEARPFARRPGTERRDGGLAVWNPGTVAPVLGVEPSPPWGYLTRL